MYIKISETLFISSSRSTAFIKHSKTMASFLYRKLLRTCVRVYSDQGTVVPFVYSDDNPLALADLWDKTFSQVPTPYRANHVIIYFSILWHSRLNRRDKLRIETVIVSKLWTRLPGFGELIKTLFLLLAEAPWRALLLLY